MTYMRARLWLGMTTAGTLVAASSRLLGVLLVSTRIVSLLQMARPHLARYLGHLQMLSSDRPRRGVGYREVAKSELFMSGVGLDLHGCALQRRAGRPALRVCLASA